MAGHRTVKWAIEILDMCKPIRCNQGGLWFGHNQNFADATFVDYGAADAFVVAAKALPDLVARNDALAKALETALRQWVMYADMGERDGSLLADEKSPEGDLFRSTRAILKEAKS